MVSTTITFRKTVMIKTTPERVWDMLSADKLMEWQTYMAKSKLFKYITPVTSEEDKYKVGTTALFFKSCHHEIIQSEKYKKLVYRKYEPPLWDMPGFTMAFIINPVEGGVKFQHVDRIVVPKGLKGLIINNIFTRRWMDRMISRETLALKKLLE